MSDIDRRGFLGSVLAKLAGAAGSVVLASAALPRASAGEDETPGQDPRERADRLAAEGDGEDEYFTSFLNGGFRNGGFRNGGFRNGGFRNGGFRNGGWRNGGFLNWPFRNGGFLNGPFRNGPFLNGGFRNAPFRNVFIP